jgi:hypothetical protein
MQCRQDLMKKTSLLLHVFATSAATNVTTTANSITTVHLLSHYWNTHSLYVIFIWHTAMFVIVSIQTIPHMQYVNVFAINPCTMKNAVFWDVVPCRPCVNRRFGGTCRLHLQGWKIPWARNQLEQVAADYSCHICITSRTDGVRIASNVIMIVTGFMIVSHLARKLKGEWT